MDIYILSRGFEQNYDYLRWLEIINEKQKWVDGVPNIFQQEATDLIQSEAPSVVLARRGDKLLLLLTAIEPEGRTDFARRQIRISVAWLSEDSKDNQGVLRMLAARALEEEERKSLTEEISQAVTLGGEEGFQAKFEDMLRLADQDKAKELLQDEPPDTAKKIAKTSSDMKRKLAEELKQYCLPKEEGALVVVTGIKNEETLKKAGVWRGLSTSVQAQDWEVYDDNSGQDKTEPIFRLPTCISAAIFNLLGGLVFILQKLLKLPVKSVVEPFFMKKSP